MGTFTNIEEIAAAINDKAIESSLFENKPSKIDEIANQFVFEFAKENNMKAHTVSPSRWWFESDDEMFEDGEVELYPLIDQAKPELHSDNKNKIFEFRAVNVKNAKLTK